VGVVLPDGIWIVGIKNNAYKQVCDSLCSIDPFLGIFVATVIILEVKLKRPVRQFQASLTKLCALLQVVVQFRYNI